MPPLEKELKDKQSRVLAYGPAHMRKTWWALAAADAGFNVIVLDSDNNLGIVSQIQNKKNIYRINIVDSFGEAICEKFCSNFFKGKGFIWDEVDKNNQLLLSTADPTHSFVKIEPGKLNYNTVIVMDSWTAYIESLKKRYNTDTKREIANNVVADSDWKDYRWTGQMADDLLTNLKHFPCHFIFIGHESHWEKKAKDGGGKEVVVDQRTQLMSTSANQSKKIAKYFNDIMYFSMAGDTVYIDTRAEAGRDGGCVNFPQKKFQWKDLKFGDHIKSTGEPLTGFTFYENGVALQEALGAKKVETKPLQATDPAKPANLIGNLTGAK